MAITSARSRYDTAMIELVHQAVGAAEFAERLLELADAVGALVLRDGPPLERHRTVELAEARVADAGVVQGERVG